MKKVYNITFLVTVLLSSIGQLSAQNQVRSSIQSYLLEHAEELGVIPQDVSSWEITDNIFNERNAIRHVHIVQTRNGVPLKNGVANVTLDDKNEVLFVGNRLISNVDALIGSSQPKISATGALNLAAKHVGMQGRKGNEIPQTKENTFVFEKGTLSKEEISVSLAYWKTNEGISLVWVVSLYQLDGEHWWQVFVDANTKEVIEQLDWVVSCDFGHKHSQVEHELQVNAESFVPQAPAFKTSGIGIGQYNVFALPVESPIHGSRSLVVSPADSLGSPFGWHDTNGVDGPDYTITQGNNVFAYTDVTNNNTADYYPNGGISMNFNFPLNLNQSPTNYQDVAVTNLFFTNNRIHDILYRYGFDESNGNFQQNNYGRGGLPDDYVYAEAQDGGGTNNANFATPGDGQNPRMQMYLWGGSGASSGNLLNINSPSTLSGPYLANESVFGPALTATGVTADLAVVSDGTLDSAQGCSPLVNGSVISGKIAVVRRGNCAFVSKVQNAQTAGAVGVIIVNNVAGGVISPGGTGPGITIPSIMISLADGNTLINSINGGTTVNGTLSADTTSGSSTKDGDFDNGIVIHEYGHGISNRIAGGPLNSNCLSNEEQMGEGWSDFFGIMLTMDTTLANPVNRGVGNFATGSPISGQGIRNAPYDTSFTVNSYTYDDVNNAGAVSQPHGIGFVWATMLWDLNWAFIDQYGFDSNIDSGSGGNNMVMQLVLDGLGLQPCSPGFVDGRDAILLADQINNSGANQCLIWKVFARRGLGFSANQGSSNSRSDQTEAFDMPSFCQLPVKAPVANFTSDVTTSCQGVVNFTDQSIDVPQAWLWNFGDGNSDTIQNPTHQYSAAGMYNVSLSVYNPLGGDTLTKMNLISITIPNPPTTVMNGTGCSSDSIALMATGSATIGWFDANGNFLSTGNTIKTAPSLSNTTYYARNGTVYPKNKVGPQNGTIGSGGYHGGNFTGTINFDAQKALTIHSAWTDAGSAGPRTITLWDGYNGNGNVIQTVTVNIPAGAGRVNLGLEVPGSGQFSIGLNQADLYRNNAGANYPYDIAGLMSLTGSSAQSGGDYYYYFYDLEVSEAACWSDSVPVVATILDTADFSYSANNLTYSFTDLTQGSTSWAWNFGDGNTSTQQNPTHTYGATGVYNVTLTVDGGSCVVSYQIGVGVNIGLDDLEVAGLNITLFPNPASEELNVAFNKSLGYATKARIYALNGKLVKEIEITGSAESIVIPLDGINSNLYVLEIDLADGKYHQKITVMK